jgi:vitamin B12 transporter
MIFKCLRNSDERVEIMKLKISEPFTGRYWSASVLVIFFANQTIFAEVESKLNDVVVSAKRVSRHPAKVSSSVSVLDPRELEQRGVTQLIDVLNESPGVIATSTAGQTGAIGSLFIRGTTTSYAQMVVDGIRVSDSQTALGAMLGAGRVNDLGRIEVLRGAQSSAYGGESVGGVLWLETGCGEGTPSGSVTAEVGSFHSVAGSVKYQGSVNDFSYFFAGGYEEGENDEPNQPNHQGRVALRAEGKLNNDWKLGTTLRKVESSYGDTFGGDSDLQASLVTVYLEGKISDRWSAKFLFGYQNEKTDYFSQSSSSDYLSSVDSNSFSLAADHVFTINDQVTILAGAYARRGSYENFDSPNYTTDADLSKDSYGVYYCIEWHPLAELTIDAALRLENYEAYGAELTWRLGQAYEIKNSGTILRSGIGRSFRTPTYLDLFGGSTGFGVSAGNPNLKAESSLGVDAGIEQKISDHHSLEFTVFQNRIEDAIKSSPASPKNLDGTTITQGVEVGARGSFFDEKVHYRVSWTHLNKSIASQPRDAVNASIDWKVSNKALIGYGVTHLSDHSWGGTEVDGYTVSRFYGSYELTENVKLLARLENAFDQQYELSNFGGSKTKGAGTGIYGGVTIDF